MMKDYYAVLGLARDADDLVVQAAWKALLRKYHPDANSNANANIRAREINEAFAVVGKPESRAAYDQTLRPIFRAGPASAYCPAHLAQVQPRPYVPRTRSPRRRILPGLLLVAFTLSLASFVNRYPDKLPDLRDYDGITCIASLRPVSIECHVDSAARTDRSKP